MFKIKAVSSYVLDVLAVPFAGPDDLDLDGEYFTSKTDLHLEQFKNPLILYWHGLDVGGSQQTKPEIIGQSLSHEIKPDGLWIKVKLDQANQYARRVWDAARQGIAGASSGSVAHLIRKAKDGFIRSWPLIELSLFDIDKAARRLPVNKRAIALVSAKSLYTQAGRDFPDLPTKAAADAEEKALKARAIQVLAEIEVDKLIREREFGRAPTEAERMYENAAIGAVNFYANTRLKSLPVRFMRIMPDGAKGAKLAGIYETDEQGNPRILLLPRGDSEAEYRTFLHECGHAIDHVLRDDDRFEGNSTFSKAVREALADEYRIRLGAFAVIGARDLFTGGAAVKSMPVNGLLLALKAIKS